MLAQRIRIGRPDRQRTYTTAANEVTRAVHAHIDDIFRRNEVQRHRRLIREVALVNRHRAACTIQSGRLVVIAAYPGDDHFTTINTGKPGIHVVVGGPGFPRQMQARIFRPQLTARTSLDNLLHGPQRHVSRLRRNGTFSLREALIQHGAIFGNHRTQGGKRRTVTAAGDGLERLGHFDWRQVKRPQDHGWHRVQLIFRHAQLLPGIGDGGQAQRHPEIHRRHVHRAG